VPFKVYTIDERTVLLLLVCLLIAADVQQVFYVFSAKVMWLTAQCTHQSHKLNRALQQSLDGKKGTSLIYYHGYKNLV